MVQALRKNDRCDNVPKWHSVVGIEGLAQYSLRMGSDWRMPVS
jgi:hypothetical protein